MQFHGRKTYRRETIFFEVFVCITNSARDKRVDGRESFRGLELEIVWGVLEGLYNQRWVGLGGAAGEL